MLKPQEPKKQTKPKACSYCESRRIIINPHYELMVEEPIMPCPRCVLPQCTCKGEEPYYYQDHGKIKECRCREVRLKIDRIKALYNRCNINRKYQWRFINHFETKHRLAENAKTAAYEIIMNFPNVRKGLYFWGNPGTGKTLLSTIILTELITRNAVEGRYIKISNDLFGLMKSSFIEGNRNYGRAEEILEGLSTIDILVIDDFGVQKNTAWEQETLYNLVDSRYENEKFTIFTSNNDPGKVLPGISEGRVLSRIREMCKIIELSGEDFREKL